VDVNWSDWDCTLEDTLHPERRRTHRSRRTLHQIPTTPRLSTDSPTAGQNASTPVSTPALSTRAWGLNGPAVRLGFRQLKSFRQSFAEQIVIARRSGPFETVEDFQRRCDLPVSAVRQLAEADAFSSIDLTRRQALWQTLPLHDESIPLFANTLPPVPARRENDEVESSQRAAETIPPLPPMPLAQQVMIDYSTAGLSLKRHPVWFAREELGRRKIITAAMLQDQKRYPHGRWVKVAGLVLVRQRPGTASGVVFITLEDETGVANLILWSSIYDRYRLAARHAALLQADGYVQRQGQVIHVLAKRLFDLSGGIDIHINPVPCQVPQFHEAGRRGNSAAALFHHDHPGALANVRRAVPR